MENVLFLLKDEVLGIHHKQVDRFGGIHGIRDTGLLESALAMPEASFGDCLMHETLSLMGAAYIYHIIKNHPFLDGNKRTGVVTGLVFLRRNGLIIPWVKDEMADLAVNIATDQITKQETADYLELLARKS